MVELGGGEVQRGLVLGAARVGDLRVLAMRNHYQVVQRGCQYHAMQTPGLGQDLVYCGLDRGLLRHVGLHCEQLAGVLFLDGGEFVAGLADVDGVDFRGAVGEAAVCYAEPDAWVLLVLVSGECWGWDLCWRR